MKARGRGRGGGRGVGRPRGGSAANNAPQIVNVMPKPKNEPGALRPVNNDIDIRPGNSFIKVKNKVAQNEKQKK